MDFDVVKIFMMAPVVYGLIPIERMEFVSRFDGIILSGDFVIYVVLAIFARDGTGMLYF